MFSIFPKEFQEVDLQDIQELIDNQERERQNIEYKAQCYERNDEGTKELLRDVSSIANAFGGYLIIGIKESKEGLPINISGIPYGEKERDRILSCILTGIESRIPGLQVKVIPKNRNRSVLLLFIPRSFRSPHMITYKGLYQFWIRHDRQKSRMSVEEIKYSFFKTQEITLSVEKFIKNQKQEILDEINKDPYYVIGVTPLMVSEEIIDIKDEELRQILQNPPLQRHMGWNFSFSVHQAHPTFNGLGIGDKNNKTLELFRNSYLEARIKIKDDSFIREKVTLTPEADIDEKIYFKSATECPIMNPYAVVEYIVNFFRVFKKIREYLGLEDVVFISISLFNIKGFGLRRYRPGTISYSDYLEIWPKTHLELPLIQFSSLSSSDRDAKDISNRIWQSFGYEEAPLFSGDKFNPVEK